MSHTCQNLLIRCMDFRIQLACEQWLKANGFAGDTDVIAVAGSCKPAAEPATCKADFMMEMIALSYEKHGARHFILTQHEDCGAYGGQSAFASPEAEKAKLIADLKKTKEILAEKFADLRFSLYWIKKTGENDWEFEQVSE